LGKVATSLKNYIASNAIILSDEVIKGEGDNSRGVRKHVSYLEKPVISIKPCILLSIMQ